MERVDSFVLFLILVQSLRVSQNLKHRVWDRKEDERGRGMEKGRVEENLMEWDSQDGGRTEMRARREILREPLQG